MVTVLDSTLWTNKCFEEENNLPARKGIQICKSPITINKSMGHIETRPYWSICHIGVEYSSADTIKGYV